MGFNGTDALASHILTALQRCTTLGAGFNGINAIASCVLKALQPCDTLLSQCDILKIKRMPRLISVTAGHTSHFCWFCHEAAHML